MRPASKQLVARGGLNAQMNNAETEGGERNGVMTALDDFMADFDRPLRLVCLPTNFGLAIVVEQARLDSNPALVAVLDRLESAEGHAELMTVAEDLQIRSMLHQHQRHLQLSAETERARGRYIDLIKLTLLDHHYIDHETRVVGVRSTLGSDEGPDVHGQQLCLPYTAIDRQRLDHLERCLDTIRAEGIDGDVLDCGTDGGGVAIFLGAYLESSQLSDRDVWVADGFGRYPDPHSPPRSAPAAPANAPNLRDAFDRFGLHDERVRIVSGPLESGLEGAPISRLALVRIGRSVGADIRAVLARCYEKLTPGGFLIVDDADGAGRHEIDAIRAEHGVTTPIERVDATTIAWRKEPD